MGLLDDINLEGYHDVSDNLGKFAIIGVSGLFPDSKSADDFFEQLVKGKDFIQTFPEERSTDLEEYIKTSSDEAIDYRKAAYLKDISKFDNAFFKMSDAEAQLIDPKQRLLLTAAYRAFEDANILDGLSNSKTGVFIGSSDMLNYRYFDLIKKLRPDLVDLSSTGNMDSMLSSRISYYFNLNGPSVVLDTACSSSLFAVDQAINSMLRGECTTALVAGAHILIYPKKVDASLGIESPDEHTRTFDDEASGTGVGEAVGAVVIKKLDDAIEDDDFIYCVIDGVLSNQDGNSISITAPDKSAQVSLQTTLWDERTLDLEKTIYVEAHGTATYLGDDIEINALTDSFKNYTDKKQFCGIGSVKTNIGHTIDASGIMSLIKCIKIIENRLIPPTINFTYPNRNIEYEDTPFYIVDKPREIIETDYQILINSFGLSGTNTHIILKPYNSNKKKVSKLYPLHEQKVWIEKMEKTASKSKTVEQQFISILEQNFGFKGVRPETELSDLNLDSLFISKIFVAIQEVFPDCVEIADFYNSTTVNDIVKKIEKNGIEVYNDNSNNEDDDENLDFQNDEFAIIGMDLKIGNSSTKERFFTSLLNGKSYLGELSAQRKKEAEELASIYGLTNLSFMKGNYLPEISKFDYKFFNIPRSEAMMMDPNARLMLTSTYRAILDSGYDVDSIRGKKWGTYIAYGQDYLFNYGSLVAHLDNSKIGMSNTGNMASLISGRIAYVSDLKGPAVTMDTSCSSSLMAIISAIQAIKDNQCETAIVGGVKLNLCPISSEENNIGILASVPHAQAFDDGANGTYAGEGVGSIVLKRKADAVRDNDRIYAVICGFGVSHDGKTSGLTVPNAEAQSDAISMAWENINFNEEDELYIETHGTATRLGDPIEVTGINRAFSEVRDSSIGIGSVKNNVGHLFEMSGMVSIIKSAMALHKGVIPQNRDFNYPNRNISFGSSKVYINDRNKQIQKNTYIGISAFGFSGTNVHLVLEKPDRGSESNVFRVRDTKLHEEECWISDYLSKSGPKLLDSNLSLSDKIKNIFIKIFGDDKDLTKNIYELGGDSLTAVEIVAQLNKIFSTDLTVADILKHGTVDELTDVIFNKLRLNSVEESQIPVAENKTMYKATPQQIRMFKMAKSYYETGLNVNLAIKMEGEVSVDKLNDAVNQIVKENVAFRTSFTEKNGELYQIIHEYEPYSIEVDKYIEGKYENQKMDFVRTFNLEKSPLFRLKLLKRNTKEYVLLFDAHHIIFDFHCMKVFLQQVISLYNGKEIPERRLDYIDFSEWYNKHLSVNHDKKLSEWVHQLSTLPSFFKNGNKIKKNTVGIKGFKLDTSMCLAIV